ncbi:MAG: hypothetical protein K2X86_01285 [Cytophagaceae bacterium]|nr:hypothetical protein [Cytophagaceae bacterium]
MKYLLIFQLTVVSIFSYGSSTDLEPGDLAIIGYNFENPDEFSFVTFADLQEGTIIYFTDCGWKSDNTFRPGEGLITYTVPVGGKKAMQVITFNQDAGFTVAGVNGFFGFSLSGDQIIAFQGSFSAPEFIYALNNNGNAWDASATDNNTSALPAGLINGLSAVALNEAENGNYNCVIENGSKNLILSSISNPSNWIGSSSRVLLPPACFEISLPVELVSFEVSNVNNILTIFFTTASESNNEKFEIEWSEDRQTWHHLTFLGAANSSEPTQYSWQTNLIKPGYYRLRQYDYDGKINVFTPVYFAQETEKVLEYFIYDIKGNLADCCDEKLLCEEMIIEKAKSLPFDFLIIKIITEEKVIIKKIMK